MRWQALQNTIDVHVQIEIEMFIQDSLLGHKWQSRLDLNPVDNRNALLSQGQGVSGLWKKLPASNQSNWKSTGKGEGYSDRSNLKRLASKPDVKSLLQSSTKLCSNPCWVDPSGA